MQESSKVSMVQVRTEMYEKWVVKLKRGGAKRQSRMGGCRKGMQEKERGSGPQLPSVQQGRVMIFIRFRVDRDSLYFMCKSE